jgi:hypothetical protein
MNQRQKRKFKSAATLDVSKQRQQLELLYDRIRKDALKHFSASWTSYQGATLFPAVLKYLNIDMVDFETAVDNVHLSYIRHPMKSNEIKLVPCVTWYGAFTNAQTAAYKIALLDQNSCAIRMIA